MKIIGLNGVAQSGKDTSGAHLISSHHYTRYSFADRIREILLEIDPRINGTVSVSELIDVYGMEWDEAESHRVYGPELLRAYKSFDKAVAKDTFNDLNRSRGDLRDDILTLDPFLDGDLTLADLVLNICGGDWEKAKKHRIHGFEVRRIMQVLGTEVVRVNYGGTAWVDVVARKIETEQPAGAVITDVRFVEEAQWVLNNGGPVLEIVRPGTVAVNGHVSENGLPRELVTATVVNDGTIAELGAKVEAALNLAPAVAQAA